MNNAKKDNNIISFNSISLFENTDTIKVPKITEVSDMDKETYSKTEIDLKFDKIQSDIQHGFEKIDLKLDSFEQRIQNILLTQDNKRHDEQEKNKKEFMYWAIGIAVGLASIAIPIWLGK